MLLLEVVLVRILFLLCCFVTHWIYLMLSSCVSPEAEQKDRKPTREHVAPKDSSPALQPSPARVFLVCVGAWRLYSPHAEAEASCVLCWSCLGNHSYIESVMATPDQVQKSALHRTPLFVLALTVFLSSFPLCFPGLGGAGFMKMPLCGLRTDTLLTVLQQYPLHRCCQLQKVFWSRFQTAQGY